MYLQACWRILSDRKPPEDSARALRPSGFFHLHASRIACAFFWSITGGSGASARLEDVRDRDRDDRDEVLDSIFRFTQFVAASAQFQLPCEKRMVCLGLIQR